MLQDMEVPGKPLPAPRQRQERKYVYERDLPCRLIIDNLQGVKGFLRASSMTALLALPMVSILTSWS